MTYEEHWPERTYIPTRDGGPAIRLDQPDPRRLQAKIEDLEADLAWACARITEESDAAHRAEAESRALRAKSRDLQAHVERLTQRCSLLDRQRDEFEERAILYACLVDDYVPEGVAEAALLPQGPDPVQEPTMEQRLETVRRVMASLDPRVEVVTLEPAKRDGWTIVARRGCGTCRLLVLDWTHAEIEAECREGLAIINARDVPPKDAVSPAFAPYSVDPDGQG